MAGDVRISGGKVRTPVGNAPVVPLLLVSIGGYLLWYSSHYWARTRADGSTLWPTDPVKAVLQGKPLSSVGAVKTPGSGAVLGAALNAVNPGEQALTQQQLAQISGQASANQDQLSGQLAAGGAAGPVIAADARLYQGAGYSWGGNASKVGDWDCSSFVSYVLGHDLGFTLPGGGRWGDAGYPPHVHGPTTLQYMLYGTGIDRSQVRAGDLIVSTVHMGIALDNSTMISAQDPQLGTGTGTFPAGFPGGTPVYRRVPAGGSATNPYPGGISGRA